MQNPTADVDLSVNELGLNARAVDALMGVGINTVDDVLAALKKGDDVLMGVEGFGPKSLTELKSLLKEHGFDVPGDGGASRKSKESSPVTGPMEEEAALAAALFDEVAALDGPQKPGSAFAAEMPAPADTPEPALVSDPFAELEAEPEAGPKPVAEAEPEGEPVSAPPPELEPAPVAAATPVADSEPAPAQSPPSGSPSAGATAEKQPSFLDRLQTTVTYFREQPGSGVWIYGVIAGLLIVALMLPPISLLRRLGITGYEVLNAEAPFVSHPDGIELSVDPETFSGKVRVRLDSVPRDVLLMGDAGLGKAVRGLPDYLEVKSPFYRIKSRGQPEQPVALRVVMPNAAEPWETLDLYTWTGETWAWVGSELHTEVAEQENLVARVTDLPDNVVIAQVGMITPTVSTDLDSEDNLASAVGGLDEINPAGLLLGVEGAFVGDPAMLLQPTEGMAYSVVPVLRNWARNAPVNQDLLAQMLNTPEIQETHIDNIVQLCLDNGYAGVEIDYRGAGPDDRDGFTGFVEELARAMHEEGLRLNVVVERAEAGVDGWETGGYDWAAIGAAADVVKVPFPDDPVAYQEGGEAERLLDWAKAQVSRHKLHMLVSSLSAEKAGGEVTHLSLEQALLPFGQAVAADGSTQVEPGGEISFAFSGQVLSITPVESANTYRLEYQATDGGTRTVWLGTAGNLAAKLNWARRYHLGGVAVTDLLAPGNTADVAQAVLSYRNGNPAPTGQPVEVVWAVSNADMIIDQQTMSLHEPGYTWMVLATPGTYTVKANVGGFDHGSLNVEVGEIAAAEEITSTEGVTESAELALAVENTEECLDARYVADVTVPDDTQFDNGEPFAKTWRVKNTGTCAWPEDTVLTLSNGDQMDAPENVTVGALEPGQEVEVTVDMTAPADPGRYTGVWRMKSSAGFFGGNLSVVIKAGEVDESVPAVAVAPVSGGSFELGGHIRDTGIPHADRMHYAGMNWTKVQVHYGQDASGIVSVSHAKGFKVQLSALGSPDMVTQPGFEQDYANWVAQLASSGADAIEVWNEPNIDREWQIGHIDPAAYTRLLCASYNAIKAANPGSAVISAAPAPTGYFGGCSANGCDDLPWLQGMYNAGAAQCMDYIGAHHNSGATSPSARSGHPADDGNHHHSWYFLPQTELYFNTFGGTRKLFYTEMGYASQEGLAPFSDAFSWARGTNNAQQAAWLAEAVQLSVNTGMVRCIIVWNIDFVRYGYDPQDGYAIIRPDGSCMACDALHNLLGTR